LTSTSKSCGIICSFLVFMRKHPDALAWFTKPESAMKKQIRETVNEKEKEQRKLLQHVEAIRDKYQVMVTSSLD
jgi:hypothetical protein